MFLLLVLTVCCYASAVVPAPKYYELDLAPHYFEEFIKEYGKQYVDEQEKEMRFQIFKDNLEEFNQKNKKNQSAVYGITQFADLSPEEFVQKFTGFNGIGDPLCDEVLHDADISDAGAPESFDWREKNVVTPVKNQKSCGSCWAFSAAGQVESQYAIKSGNLVRLSEQQILDCDSGNCSEGGLMTLAFKALIGLGGPMKEDDYPYEEYKNECRSDKSKIVVKVTKCTSYLLRSQEKVKQLLYQKGPIAIAIKAQSLKGYVGGIVTDEDCVGEKLDHAVLLVGYGSENNSPYWIVKNSWGSVFGEAGYFRMQRDGGSDGACGMVGKYNNAMSMAFLE